MKNNVAVNIFCLYYCCNPSPPSKKLGNE